MKTALYVGDKDIEWPAGGYLLITDKLPKKLPKPRHPMETVEVFDPLKHSFNAMQHMDADRAEELAELIYTLTPGGSETLTARNGKLALAQALLDADRLDRVKGSEEVALMIGSVLFSPTRRNVLCRPTNFSFNVHSVILAHIDPKALGEKTALAIGLFLIDHFKGQLIIPEFGFYAREIHSKLIRENRLIAGVNELKELPEKLRSRFMLVPDKKIRGATWDDAVELAKYRKPHLERGTNEYNDFIEGAIA